MATMTSATVHSFDASAQSAAIHSVFALQKAYAPDLALTSARQRIAALKRLQRELLKRKQIFRDAMMADFRKPATEVDLTELFPVTAEIKHTCSHLSDWMKPEKVGIPIAMLGTSAEIRYQPRGVCLIISPWNFPVNLTLMPVVSAIAAGNTVVIKTSELTPHTSQAMADLVEAVFDPREVALFQGDASVAQELLALPFNHIFFTGSPTIGKVVMRAAADHLSSVTLELGGKSPVIVHESADLEDAARSIAWGKYVNNGQVCLSPDYILLPEQLQDKFSHLVELQVQKFYGKTEEARRASSSYARIVNDRHFLRLKGLIDDAVAKGARPAFGGITRAEERYIAPTLLNNITDDMAIMQEEIFGPIMPVLLYTELEDAISYVNERPRPLALYVYSGKSAPVDYILERTISGGVCINNNVVQFFNPNIPFGGVNNSGFGSGHGVYGFRAFSHARGVVNQQPNLTAMRLMMPPYTNNVDKLVDLTIKLF